MKTKINTILNGGGVVENYNTLNELFTKILLKGG